MTITNEELQTRYEAYKRLGSYKAAAKELGLNESSVRRTLTLAASQGRLGYDPVLPGMRIAKVTRTPQGDYVQQKPELGEPFELPSGHMLKGVSALVDANGNVMQSWQKTTVNAQEQEAALRAMVDALKEDLPRVSPVAGPMHYQSDLLNQYTVTDNHFGMLAWREEGGADYDLKIAEQLLTDWFHAAISDSPRAHTAVMAQLGDLMHHDALESVTPAHGHVLDADSRLQKVIRVVIRTVRRVIGMLLDTHNHVHIVMASGNHDPASSAWLREMLAAMYENETRISVDNSPMLYYSYEWGKTALFYHHGHKAGIKDLDRKMAGLFRDLYGRSMYAYCHFGHKHSDEGIKTELMYLEQHETLAAQDAYSSSGKWLTNRSAKRITYHKEFGEVARGRISPEMVMGKE